MAKKEEKTKAEEQEAKVEEPAPAEEPDETAKLQKQLDESNEKFLRLAAEYDNYRKRTAKEKEETNAFCKCSVIKELLPVIDNLDRALQNNAENVEDYKKGVEMIGNQFYEVLKKLGVEDFGEVGEAFDPNLHNAVMHIEDESMDENVLSAVFSKGYRLDERVIRPAMVQVAN